MARIFNIYFTHNDSLHSAIVSVRITPFFTEYHLGNLDTELRLLLPSTKAISPMPGNIFFQHVQPEHSAALMTEIIKSIEVHLREHRLVE